MVAIDGGREGGLAGRMKARFLTDAQGRVRDTQMVQAASAGVLWESDLATVRKWRFKPGEDKT